MQNHDYRSMCGRMNNGEFGRKRLRTSVVGTLLLPSAMYVLRVHVHVFLMTLN